MHQEVEVLVADGRLVQHVVAVVVFVQFLAQLYDSLFLIHCLQNLATKLLTLIKN